jgi:hypothetical protein
VRAKLANKGLLAGFENVDCECIKVLQINLPYVVISPFVLIVLRKLPIDKRVDFVGVQFSSIDAALSFAEVVVWLVRHFDVFKGVRRKEG